MKWFKCIQSTFGVVAAGVLLCTGTLPAQAQATRTWVSGVGDDANPCSRTAPCKTFGGAISKTASHGEINVLDGGGFGAVTITKSITIDGHPAEAGVLVSGTNGIIINAGANDVVTLRGLDIQGLTTGLSGISILSVAAVYVEDSVVNGFTTQGIDFEPTAAHQVSRLFLNNVTVQQNGPTGSASGVLVKTTAVGAAAQLTIDNSRFEFNGSGITADANSRVTIRDSVLSSNSLQGVQASPSAGTADVNIENSVISYNLTGLLVNNNGTVRLSNTTVAGNYTGLSNTGTGAIISYGNNRLHGNGLSDNQNGAPTQTVSQQ
jgi:hypothetical protein